MLVCLLVEVDMFSVFPYYGLEKEKKTIFFDIVRQNSGKFLEDLELDFKLFFFVDSGSVYIVLEKFLSDATLASLSISIYPRWHPR